MRTLAAFPRVPALAAAAVLLMLPWRTVPAARAEPLARDTRTRVEAVLAKHRENRAQIANLRMTGTIEEDHYTPAGHWPRVRGTFKYLESGSQRRVDQHFDKHSNPNGQPSMLEGRTQSVASDGKRTLANLSNAELAHVDGATSFEFASYLRWLDDIERSRVANSHVTQIEYLLNRGWDAARERIVVVEERSPAGKPLVVVDYRSTIGGEARQRWEFDPARGHEVVRASMSSSRPDGKVWSSAVGEYKVREIQPGVWRAVGALITRTEEISEGQDARMVVKIENTGVTVNGEPVSNAEFTFAGLNVKPGTTVADVREKPARQLVVGSATLSETKLDQAFAAKDALAAISRSDLRDPIWRNPVFIAVLIATFAACVGIGAWYQRRRRSAGLKGTEG